MNLKKSHIEILNLFRKNIFLSGTIKEISRRTKKDYPNTYYAVNELAEKSIIRIKKIGNIKLCEISLSQEAISILSFLDEQEALSANIPNIRKILDFKEFLDDIFIVTGSYAKRKQTPKSDIDLVIIAKDKAFEKQKLIENLISLFIPKIHPIAITQKDFMDMLIDKKANFGKEIFKNRLIFRNTSRYYEIIKEAIDNGFRS